MEDRADPESLATHATLWQAAPALARLLSKPVEDGLLIYNGETGLTQLLSPLGEFVVEALKPPGTRLSTADIVQQVLNADAEDGEDPDAGAAPTLDECTIAIEQALQVLVGAGLVQIASSLDA